MVSIGFSFWDSGGKSLIGSAKIDDSLELSIEGSFKLINLGSDILSYCDNTLLSLSGGDVLSELVFDVSDIKLGHLICFVQFDLDSSSSQNGVKLASSWC